MKWSLRTAAVNLLIGVGVFALPWGLSKLTLTPTPEGHLWVFPVMLVYLPVAGLVISLRRPGALGASALGVFLCCAMPAQIVGGPTASAIDLGLGVLAAALELLGEAVGGAMCRGRQASTP